MAHKKIIRSFSRLSEHGSKFWESLYKKLMIKKPDTLKYFGKTDMHALYTMLSNSVTYIVLNSSSDTVQSSEYFQKVVKIHNDKLKIPKTYIWEWRNCLLQTIQEFDSELTEAEFEIWRQAVDIIIEPIGVE